MSVNDQFNMGRIPIRPLSLTDKALAQTKELLIDNVGDNPSYHIYITDQKDRTRLIDLTLLYSENPNISGDSLMISIDGLIDPQSLKYIINFIYKRFLMPENPNGYNPALDFNKVFDQDTTTILLKDTGNNIIGHLGKQEKSQIKQSIGDKRYPISILKFNRIRNGLHPTQKPVELLEWLIKTYTNEGETVLDNCMGSGSTGVACINTNRKFIGIEKDDKYFEIAYNRINEYMHE